MPGSPPLGSTDPLEAQLAALRPGLDIAALRDTYLSDDQHAPVDPDAFVSWLHDRGEISADELALYHTQARVEVTLDDALDPIDDEAAATTADVLLGPAELDEARYDKLQVIGAGAMGEVHVAKDRRLRRRVAFKQMKERAVRRGHSRRFLREVQITSQLEHPQIVPVYDLHLAGEAPAFAMKLVEGRDLSTLITEARELNQAGAEVPNTHALQTRLEHFLKVCDAVQYAHDKGVIHRDLKPANIRVGRHNEVYVLDWGVSRVFAEGDAGEGLGELETVELSGDAADVAATRVGAMVGTPAYMAPEQADPGMQIDERADQYALGLILHELVTLRQARQRRGRKGPELLAAVARGEHEPIEHVVPGRAIPAELAAIIDKALRRDRRDRYPSVSALADDIRSWLRGQETTALPDRGLRKLRRWVGRHRRWALGTLVPFALIIPVAAALAITGWSSYEKGQQTVATLSSALRDEITARLLARLDEFVTAARMANEANLARLELGHLDLEDHRAWKGAMLEVTKQWSDLAWTEFGLEDGRYVGVEHRLDGTRRFAVTDAETGFQSYLWEMDDEGNLGKLTEEGPYDPRKRPWYEIPAKAKEPRWTEPYYYFSRPILGMSLGHPVYDADGQLLGVFASDRTLEGVSEFMRSQEVGETGQTFVFDRSGLLIATSANLPVGTRRFKPSEIQDPAVQAAAAHLELRFGSLTEVSGAEQWSFELGDERYLAQMAPFSDPFGLDWTVVVVIPESDFTQHIEAHTRGTVWLGVGVLLAAVLVGAYLAFRVRERVD